MENQIGINNYKELLSPEIKNNPSRFLELMENIDSSTPTRESALILKKAMELQKDSVLWFLLKKSFRLAAFKLKGTAFKISLAGLEKLLHSPDRLDDLALAITSVNQAEAFLASDYFKTANWKEYPTQILPCFCVFFKNYGNSQDCEDLLELTRHPNPVVIAAAVEAIKKLDTGSMRSIIAPLIQKNAEQKGSEAIESLYATNVNYDSSNISNESKEYYVENHKLILDTLKNSDSEREITRILRLVKKYGNEEDAEAVKPFLINDKPDIVRAAIKVLEKLDSEYLCIYLPQLLQDKNSKVRLTATKAFQSIDKDSIANMVISLLKSLNVKQRTLGITTAMLMDFERIREPLLNLFSKENNEELLEKIGLVLAANPYRELVRDAYFAHKASKTLLKKQREKIIELLSEKVSSLLGGNPWPKELIEEAKKIYEDYTKNAKPVAQETVEQEDKTKVDPNASKAQGFYKNLKPLPKIDSDIKALNPSVEKSDESLIAKLGLKGLSIKSFAIILFFLSGAILWGILLVVVIMKMF